MPLARPVRLTVNDLSHRYLWGPAVDQILADEQLSPPAPRTGAGEGQGEGGEGSGAAGYDLTQPGNVVWPLTDNLGTVRDLAVYNAATGVTSVANHRVYDSFGNLKSQTNAAVDCLFGFTGKPLDPAGTGLQNNKARMYEAALGDWLSKDPTSFTAGDTNTGRYCGGSAVACADPSGLWKIDRGGWLTATATADSPSDTIDTLGAAIGLSPSEARGWLVGQMVDKVGFGRVPRSAVSRPGT